MQVGQQRIGPAIQAVGGGNDACQPFPYVGRQRDVIDHLRGGPYAGQRIADVVRHHRHQRAQRGLLLGTQQRFAAGRQIGRHRIDRVREPDQFGRTALRHPVLQLPATDVAGGLHDGGKRLGHGAAQIAPEHDEDDGGQQQRQGEQPGHHRLQHAEPAIDRATLLLQLAFELAKPLFEIVEGATLQLQVEPTALGTRRVGRRAQQHFAVTAHALVSQTQRIDGRPLLGPAHLAIDEVEVAIDVVGVMRELERRADVAEKGVVEHLLDLTIEAAAHLQYLRAHSGQPVAFAGGVLPQLQPAPPHRAGKQQQTEIERRVTQLQSFQGMRFTDEMAGQGPDTPHGWSAKTVQETRPEPGGVRRPTTTGAAVTRGGSARTRHDDGATSPARSTGAAEPMSQAEGPTEVHSRVAD